MSEFGLDDVINQKEEKEAAVVEVKPKRKPFQEWEVGGRTYKLKLTTAMICKLEEKFHQNLINVVTQDGLPSLAQMLTITQGAMAPWHHNTTYTDVQRIFDRYVEEGGNQLAFYSDIIMGVMSVSGFFTEAQAKEITQQLEKAEVIG